MLSFLSDIWNAIRDVPFLVVGFFVDIINGAIISIGAFLNVVFAVLPGFPSAPSAPNSGVLSWLLYFVPLGSILSFAALMLTCWVTFLGIKVALKWMRAI